MGCELIEYWNELELNYLELEIGQPVVALSGVIMIWNLCGGHKMNSNCGIGTEVIWTIAWN